MRNKWLITLVGLTIAFAAITGGSFALAGEGTDAPDVVEPSGDGLLVTSIDDIDPNECNWIHNITACNDTPVIGPDGEGAIEPDISLGEPSGDGPTATSGDDIDPNECNWIHNITACNDTPVVGPDGEGVIEPDISRGEPSGDEPTATSIDDIDPNVCNWIHNITACNDTLVIGPDGEGAIEPGFSVGEPYPMPTADKSCGPMAVVAITSEGEVSCLDLAPDTGDDQGQLSPARPPVAEPVQ